MNKLTPIAAALVLISGVANATTFGPLDAVPNPVTLSGGSARVYFNDSLSHADNVPGSCGLQLDYGDGSAPEPFLAHVADVSFSRYHDYAKAGTFNATLSPVSMLNPAGAMRPACSGSPASVKVTVNPAPASTGGSSPGSTQPGSANQGLPNRQGTKTLGFVAYAEIADVKLSGGAEVNYRGGGINAGVTILPHIKDGKSCTYVVERTVGGHMDKYPSFYTEGAGDPTPKDYSGQDPFYAHWSTPVELGHLNQNPPDFNKIPLSLTVTVKGAGAKPCLGTVTKTIDFGPSLPALTEILRGPTLER